ncbi:MAG: hypothetical protein V3S19_07205 [Gemmatimonadales bacterium]
MAEIRAIDVIAKKWAAVTPLRSPDYEAGVREPRRDWQRQTLAAKDAWKSGVTAAIARDGFAKGVQRSGTTQWQEAALTKGVQRWGPGVALGEDAYMRGFAPYQAAISRISLPPRYARRDPRNLERVRVIVEAMSKVKEAAASS